MFGLHSGDGHQLWSMSYPPTVRMGPTQLSSALSHAVKGTASPKFVLTRAQFWHL